MRVMIFGGTGFIGKAIADKLYSVGYQVDILSRTRESNTQLQLRYVAGDLIEGSYPALNGYDVIVNCAGEIRAEDFMRPLHVVAVEKALDTLSARCGVHWVQISSVGVYGPRVEGIIDEGDEFKPVGSYEETKAEGEILVRERCLEKGIPFTVLRPSNVFGEGMPNRSLAQLLGMIRKGIFFYIGNPNAYTMNYVYVEDVVQMVMLAITNPNARNQDFIISDCVSQRDFVQIAREELGGRGTLQAPGSLVQAISRFGTFIPGFPLTNARISALTLSSTYSTTKAEHLLGYSANVGIVAGLRRYCRHLKANA
ncbi:hypothetical protein LCGC14_0144590 [marine sediment metagenome]|nr:NAD(P)-dependent oxidoreductase [Marinobacter antarcticus]